MSTTVIADVRPWGGELSDVLVVDGIVQSVETAGDSRTQHDSMIDGAGGLLLPAFADVHVHLDSNRLGLPFRSQTGVRGREGRIMNDRAHWRSAEWSVADRATYALRQMIALGATRVRSHAQVDVDSGLEKFEGVLAAREACREYADVEIVAFPQVGLHREQGAVALMDEALSMGADVVGGIDPCELDRDPVRHLDSVFALADKHQKPIDIHLHEAGMRGLFSLDLIIERTRALGMAHQVTISHAFCLADPSGRGVAAGIDDAIGHLVDLDVALTTIAPGGGLDLPIRRMVDAGVRVGLGMDGQRDYWSPYGNGDMLDRAYQLAFTQDFDYDDELELALAVASVGGAAVIDPNAGARPGQERPGVAPGDPAEFVLLDAECSGAALMDRPRPRTVIHRGAVVPELADADVDKNVRLGR